VSVADALGAIFKLPAGPVPKAIPTDVKLKQDRGRKVMLKDAARRRLCMRFRRGESYWFIAAKGMLTPQSTTDSIAGVPKPPHRIRNRYDFLGPIIDAKVSAATQKIPSYEINPSTGDQRANDAAEIATKVALYGYDKWRLRTVTTKVVDLAIGGGGVGYALPYFDPNVGPYTPVGDRMVGQGELKVLHLTGNQVYSEPGVEFEDSRWYAIERARPMDEVDDIPGFVKGVELKADAQTSDIPTDRDASDNLVMVTEFFERPCPDYPDGRCMTFANARPIIDYRQDPDCPEDWTDWWGPYPLVDVDGSILDEPILHRLVFRQDPDTDHDLGLTWRLIDFERTAQDVYNKILEYKNRGLNPQMLAQVNSLIGRPDDVPGAVKYFQGQVPPTWQDPPPPAILTALLQILERTVNDMRDVAFDVAFDVAPNVAAQTVGAANTQSENKWAMFLGDLAEWHSRVMRHCLLLVARHYTEPRLIALNGRFGPQNIQNFMGSHLMGQVTVRVNPDSLASRSRAQVQQELAWIQANWPGYLSPEVAIAALHGGTAENLIRSYELDMARVNNVIQAIVNGTVLDMPARQEQVPGPPDPVTGQPGAPQTVEVGSYMPGEMDSLPIWKKAFGDFMKTNAFDTLTPEMQTVAQQVWSALKLQESQQAAQAQAAQMAEAQRLGSQNAAAPQTKGVPSQPGVSAPAQQQP
jgi:hypothetical protein